MGHQDRENLRHERIVQSKTVNFRPPRQIAYDCLMTFPLSLTSYPPRASISR